MKPGRDDDALSWDGDDDPTLELGDAAPRRTLPEGYTAVGRGADALSAQPEAAPAPVTGETERIDETDAAAATTDPAPEESESDAASEAAPMGSAALVSLGVLGGVYALYTIGWLIGGLRLQGVAQYLVADAMFQGSLWLAVLAPLLWFGTVFLLTRHARLWVRLLWLAGGVVLLLPWPFVMIGTVGQ